VAQFQATPVDAPVQFRGSLSHWQSERYDAPDSLPNDESRQHLSLALSAGAFSLRAVAVQRDYDGREFAVGGPGQPPPPPGATRPTRQDETNHAIQARYRWERDPEHRLAAWLQYNRSDFDRGPAGFDGSRWELGSESVWRFGSHLLLAQLQLADLRIHDAFLPPSRMLPPINESRDYLAFTLQDQIDIGERVQLTGGLRYDRMQGIDAAWTPRLAALWKVSDRHLLKAQYAEGFRSPTYLEIYVGGPPAEHTPFERVRTLEVAYIFRTANTVFRATAFDTRVSDMIFPRDSLEFGAGNEINGRGWEFELTHQWSPRFKSMATWSTANADDDRAAVIVAGQPTRFGGPSLGQAEALGNLALLATINREWSAGLHWNHVGRRADQGQAGRLPGYESVNLGIEFSPARIPGLRLSMTWRNLLDEPIMHIASQPPNSVLRLRYDEPQWSLSAQWDFD
jgi:outer membrane receptor protein involved in Fe transport